MDNKTIYKKTLGFSLRRLFWNFISLLMIVALSVLGFIITKQIWDLGIIGLFIGMILGFIVLAVISRFISYSLKAGQIAMMTKGIVDDELPDNVVAEGKKIVKQRFLTVALYFAATNAIKSVFNQIGKVITGVGQNVGGDVGGAVGSTINSVIQTIISYLCDCCLGWVFYRKDVNAARATCEGAVLFFKHGKTFAKNMGRVFGIGLVSFIVIAGAFMGIFYLILLTQQTALSGIYAEIAASAAESTNTFARILQNPVTVPIVFSFIGGSLVWGFIHSAFIKPFVLVGVLRNYIESGKDEVIDEASFASLDAKSPKFKKLHEEMNA